MSLRIGRRLQKDYKNRRGRTMSACWSVLHRRGAARAAATHRETSRDVLGCEESSKLLRSCLEDRAKVLISLLPPPLASGTAADFD